MGRGRVEAQAADHCRAAFRARTLFHHVAMYIFDPTSKCCYMRMRPHATGDSRRQECTLIGGGASAGCALIGHLEPAQLAATAEPRARGCKNQLCRAHKALCWLEHAAGPKTAASAA